MQKHQLAGTCCQGVQFIYSGHSRKSKSEHEPKNEREQMFFEKSYLCCVLLNQDNCKESFCLKQKIRLLLVFWATKLRSQISYESFCLVGPKNNTGILANASTWFTWITTPKFCPLFSRTLNTQTKQTTEAGQDHECPCFEDAEKKGT